MDRKTFIQFIIVSALIILGWELFSRVYFAPPPPETDEPAPVEYPDDEVEDPFLEPPEDLEDEEPDVVEGLVLANNRISMEWTNRGAGLQSLQLLDYRAPYFEEDADDDSERPKHTLLREMREGVFSDVLESIIFIDERSVGHEVPVAGRVYEVLSHTSDEIVFQTSVRGRLDIRKTVTIAPDEYHFSARLEFINKTDDELRFEFALRTAAGIEREMLRTRYLATLVAVRDRARLNIDFTGPGDIEEPVFNRSRDIVWSGMASQYFIAMLWPDSPEWIEQVESRLLLEDRLVDGTGLWRDFRRAEAGDKLAEDNPNAVAIIHSTRHSLPAGGSLDKTYRFVTAPILSEILDAYSPGLVSDLRSGRIHFVTQLLSLGTITIFAPIMVWILDLLYSIIPNYGIAIILLTLLIRALLHPLTRSTQLSMHKTKKLQPQLQELMKKHGDDKQAFAREQWKLYSKYGVNPMKGCLPMFLQMPVFLALFETLRTSVQLRQAAFIPGWINDLSQPDTVWQMPFRLPLLGSDLNILPFIMVGAWVLNQQLMPTPADPKAQQQQKMMKWMPVIFAFMFYNFASGLLLYITLSSAVGAIEHWHIRKKAEGIELVPVDARKNRKSSAKKRPASGRGAGKGKTAGKGWLQRLMELEEESKKNIRKLQSSKDSKKNRK